MKITGSQAMLLIDIASRGAPIPYDKSKEEDAIALEKLGLIERHHVGTDKVGAKFTPAGVQALGAIIATVPDTDG